MEDAVKGNENGGGGHGDLAQALTQSCPDGVDVYFDNTAGRISDAVLPRINRHARIVVCGTAAIASWDPWPEGPRVERHLLNKAAQMSGFLVWDYEHRYEEAVARLKAETDLPVAVGFGVRTPEQAEAIAKVADGVVVGSALVEIVGREGENAPAALKEFTAALARAVHNAREPAL